MKRASLLALLVFAGCEKKPAILGTFEGTANVKARGDGAAGSVDVKKDFTGVKVTIKPMMKETALKKPVESENEVTIVLENGPFTKPCTLDGLYTGGKNEAVIASNLHPNPCAMAVDTWSNDAVELSPLFEIFGKDEVHANTVKNVEGSPRVFLTLELKLVRKR